MFTHVSERVQEVLEGDGDMTGLNPFVRDAIVGKLVNPKVVSQ